MGSFTGSPECWALLISGLLVGFGLISMGMRLQIMALTTIGALATALALGWAGTATAHAQAPQRSVTDGFRELIDDANARAEALKKELGGFVAGVEARPNPYEAEAARMAAQNVSRVRQGFGLVGEVFGDEVGDPLAGVESDGAFYVAVSFSMPPDVLRRLATDAHKAGGKLVIRGLVEGSFEKTLLAARQVFDDKAMNGVAIDPQVFRAYKVDRVPTFIVAREPVTPCQDGVDCTSAATAHDKIAGNITTAEALRQISQRGRQAPDIAHTAFRRLESTF